MTALMILSTAAFLAAVVFLGVMMMRMQARIEQVAAQTNVTAPVPGPDHDIRDHTA